MQEIDLTNTEQLKTQVESYGFKVVTWQEFLAAEDRPEGLIDRALSTESTLQKNGQATTHVVYDPDSDSEGWMLIGTLSDIVLETANDLISIDPPEGPFASNAA